MATHPIPYWPNWTISFSKIHALQRDTLVKTMDHLMLGLKVQEIPLKRSDGQLNGHETILSDNDNFYTPWMVLCQADGTGTHFKINTVFPGTVIVYHLFFNGNPKYITHGWFDGRPKGQQLFSKYTLYKFSTHRNSDNRISHVGMLVYTPALIKFEFQVKKYCSNRYQSGVGVYWYKTTVCICVNLYYKI